MGSGTGHHGLPAADSRVTITLLDSSNAIATSYVPNAVYTLQVTSTAPYTGYLFGAFHSVSKSEHGSLAAFTATDAVSKQVSGVGCLTQRKEVSVTTTSVMWTSPATADAPVTLQSVVTFKKKSAIATLVVPASGAPSAGAITEAATVPTTAAAGATGTPDVSTKEATLPVVPTTAVGVVANDDDGNAPEVNAANVANNAAAVKPVSVSVEAGNITIIAALAGCLAVVAIVFAVSFVKMTGLKRNMAAAARSIQQAKVPAMIEVPSAGTTPEPVSPVSIV